MALVHEFENSGNWLFKRRSWLPFIIITGAIILMYLGNKTTILFNARKELIFLSVSIAGQIIRIITVGYTPRNTSGRNTVNGQIADELNVTGIYSLLRHPLYLGNFFMWLGPALFLRSWWFTIIFCLIYWLYYERIMFAEEQFLRKKFGDSYDKWSEKVRSIVPGFSNYIPSPLHFSIRNVLKREHNSFFNIFVIFTFIDLIRNYYVSERIFLNNLWLYFFASAFIIWLAIKIIHKKTRWLIVDGR
jgi:protein-S-isoprenylcysteine O-methyltransferase Ste14